MLNSTLNHKIFFIKENKKISKNKLNQNQNIKKQTRLYKKDFIISLNININ